MQVNADAVDQLHALAARDNFAPDGAMYTGVHDPALRAILNVKFDASVGKFVALVQHKATKQEYLNLIGSEIATFHREYLDTEDAEQVAANFEKIMNCIGLESSDGILNTWMYGFDPNQH
jgi:hypothetical protein